MIAESALNVVNTEVVVPAPKQTKLLGATVKGLGVIVCVSQSLKWGYAIIEDASGKNHHAFLADLKKDQLEFPSEPQPYRLCTMRVGYGLWDEVYSLLIPAQMEQRMAA
jgi:hypothetical protein